MSDRRPDGSLSCLGCGGCLTLFVVVSSIVVYAIAGTDWLLQAIAAAILVAFLVGIVAMHRGTS
jgi:uncharacterized protein YqhQ